MIFSNISFIIFIFFFLLLSFIFPEYLGLLKNYIPLLLGAVMFGMGTTISISQIKKVLSKPLVIFTAVGLQFTVMPIIAICLLKTFDISSELALGVIILGSCPGGTASNVIAYLCKADVALSVICTFTSTLISVIVTPMLIQLLANENVEINVFKLIKSTFYIVFFPVVLGLIFNSIFKEMKTMNFYLPKVSEFLIALIIGVILSLNFENIHNVTSSLLIIIFIHNILGLFFGYSISNLFNFPLKEKKTISIEVGMQNSGLGMALSIIHFGKMVALPSAIFSLCHNISSVVLVYLWKKK